MGPECGEIERRVVEVGDLRHFARVRPRVGGGGSKSRWIKVRRRVGELEATSIERSGTQRQSSEARVGGRRERASPRRGSRR
jgi:hypothetical protein